MITLNLTRKQVAHLLDGVSRAYYDYQDEAEINEYDDLVLVANARERMKSMEAIREAVIAAIADDVVALVLSPEANERNEP
jgi:hypothetical protein